MEKALKGQVLEHGWKILGRKVKSLGATGACHSVGFTAEHSDGRKAFVKVMEPTPDPTLKGREQLKELERRLAVFIYEGELMEKCLTRRIRRVIKAIGQGSIAIKGFPNEIHYMLLQLADNDLRELYAVSAYCFLTNCFIGRGEKMERQLRCLACGVCRPAAPISERTSGPCLPKAI